MTPEDSTVLDFSLPIQFIDRKEPYSQCVHNGPSLMTMADLKSGSKGFELISEFYCEPSFLLGNRFKEPITLPKFAKDPYNLVYIQRKTLESEQVSDWIPQWIDGIFGVHSRAVLLNSPSDQIQKTGTGSEMGNTWHLRISNEVHPPRKSPQECSLRSMFDKDEKINIYKPSQNSVGKEIIQLATSPTTHQIAAFTSDQMIIYDSRMKQKAEAKNSSQGLTVLHEAHLNEAVIVGLSSLRVFLWSRMVVVGVISKQSDSLGVYEVASKAMLVHRIHTSSISELALNFGESHLYTGTVDGQVAISNLKKDKLTVLHRLFLGSCSLRDSVHLVLP